MQTPELDLTDPELKTLGKLRKIIDKHDNLTLLRLLRKPPLRVKLSDGKTNPPWPACLMLLDDSEELTKPYDGVTLSSAHLCNLSWGVVWLWNLQGGERLAAVLTWEHVEGVVHGYDEEFELPEDWAKRGRQLALDRLHQRLLTVFDLPTDDS